MLKCQSAEMETNLQSSEVRIPKSPHSPATCPQFKSTFARSLSFNTNNQPTKPLDFEISFRIAQNLNHSPNRSASSPTATVPSHKVDEADEDFEEFMRNSPMKQSLQNSATTPTTPTRKSMAASRAFNTTCSGRHRIQVQFSPFVHKLHRTPPSVASLNRLIPPNQSIAHFSHLFFCIHRTRKEINHVPPKLNCFVCER